MKMDASKQPGLQFSQVILLKATFAHRDDVFALPPTTQVASIPLKIETRVGGKTGDASAVIRVRVFTDDSPELLYRFDVEVAALVTQVVGEENLDPFEFVQHMGPAALYPFLREAVANITMKGRFGPVWLKPFNFAMMGDKQAEPTADEVAEPSEAVEPT
jgi:preprotein translocase subunit SecB